MLGELLIQQKVNGNLNDIDIGSLASGVYVVKVSGNEDEGAVGMFVKR